MTAQEALIELRALIKNHKVELSWDTKPESFEELIVARDGPELLNRIDEVINKRK